MQLKPVLLWVLCGGMSVSGCSGSAFPTPTPAPANPELVCHPLPTRIEELDCHEALAVAIDALPPGDRPIRASFVYGTNCADTAGCGISPAANRTDFGLVTFSYAGTEYREYLYVVADESGRARLGGVLSSAPPPLMSVPTPVPSSP